MSSVVSILTANKLYAQALELVGDELSKNAAQQRDIKDLENRMRQRDSSRDLLVAALGVYHAAGRHADVLELLQSAPNWKVSDLSELLAVRSDGVPVGYIAAAALADVGKNDQARAILHAMLDANGGYDPAYALLVKIDGPAALAKLDELFSRDRFEERPLIWRAEILRQQRKLDEAEKIARQAISIDPSDGEQPRGDRMRVYAVLADILADQGNPEGAKAFREVVAAIRMSEDADRLHSAGLLKRAVELYQKALTHFADAYCIQSRLAVQLSQMGMTRAAAEHYQRAYELMPDSFGRVESHCFGCEQAFAGQEAQSIAERVFTKLAADQPRKPQVHYLLGYLREAQGRYPEALASFKTATQLDPDYLNAWKHLTELGDHVHIPAAEMDSAALNILRLDPLQRHVHAPYVEVRSLARLWEVVADASTKYPPKVESLLPLQASMVARKDTDKATQLTLEEYTPASIQSAPLPTPADAIASTTAMQIIRSLMSANQEQ